METRSHVHEEHFSSPPGELFALLHTPSAIRVWWSAPRAIVVPEEGGVRAAAWGKEEDSLDYVTVATIGASKPPHRLLLEDYRYWAKDGPLPFDASLVTEFVVNPHDGGARLRVNQAGFPVGREGDELLDACDLGWRDTYSGIRAYLDRSRARSRATQVHGNGCQTMIPCRAIEK